jgi:hypothetical protein
MMSGHTSVLRNSRVQVGAKFQAEWSSITNAELLVWQSFWKEIDTWDVVALHNSFWPAALAPEVTEYYKRAASTYNEQQAVGWWRMAVPKIEPVGLICNSWAMAIEFTGVYD